MPFIVFFFVIFVGIIAYKIFQALGEGDTGKAARNAAVGLGASIAFKVAKDKLNSREKR